jgi:hypothetical protein
MSDLRDLRQPAFDPFGEPMASVCPRAVPSAEQRGYGETRRAALVFWALAVLLVVSRIYVAEGPSAGTFAADVPQSVDMQVAALR